VHVNYKQVCSAEFAPIDNAARTLFYFQSRRGDWVGAGKTEVFSASNAVWTAPGGSAVNSINLNVQGREDDFGSRWSLILSSPTGTVLATGFYGNAGRFAGATNPGIDIGGNGRGCNSTNGSFLISELERNPDQSIRALALDFEQHC